jgi:hypothetical protein
MERTSRQEQIAHFDQAAIRGVHVVVVATESEWLGPFAVQGLAHLGIRQISWVRGQVAANDQVAKRSAKLIEWVLGQPLGDDVIIVDYPHSVEYGSDLDYILRYGARPSEVLYCGHPDDDNQLSCCRSVAQKHNLPLVSARAHRPNGSEDPVVALALAAQLVDTSRMRLAPLPDDAIVDRTVNLPVGKRTTKPFRILQIGAGGIGTWLAAGLAASDVANHCRLHLVDGDGGIELSNLNRQLGFTSDDAGAGRGKADTLAKWLRVMFPGFHVTSEQRYVDEGYLDNFASQEHGYTVVVSAVDNAKTRLLLSELSAIPVVNGATDVFSADVFVQTTSSPKLDEQMFGALSAAAEVESTRRPREGDCMTVPSYVAPSMMAGAMVAQRVHRVLAGDDQLPPIRWRAGDAPREDNWNGG